MKVKLGPLKGSESSAVESENSRMLEMQICAGCECPILDRFLLNVLDRVWHTRCVQCTDCNVPLTDKCFSREGKLYCRDDFFLRYGTKCAGCLLGISPSDLVRRARNKVFHLKCFTCMMCRKELSTGEELYILDENKFICKEDYLSSKLSGSDVDDDGDFDSIIENQDSEKDFNTESDSMETKRELFINNSDQNQIKRFNDQLNSQMNAPNSETMLPQSPVPLNLTDSKISQNSVNSNSNSIKEEPMDQLSDSCPSPPCSSESQAALNTNPGSNCSSMDANDNNNNKEGNVNEKSGNKRRGPRTTIKAKQLEVLKASFNATPKPTRHIREQLAAETGLNMRVIQVWFQNRRSKERRMKQLSALGARRHFFRSPRRMRALRAGMSPSELEETELMGPGYGYYNDNGQDFYPGFPGPGYGDFFPGQGPEMPPGMGLLPPGRGTPPMNMDHPLHPAHMGPEGQFLPQDMMPPAGSPEPMMHPEDQYLMSLPPRSLPGGQYPPHSTENW